MAWADGTLAPAERQGLERLIENAPLENAARQKAQTFLSAPVELDTADLHQLTPDARKGIYRSACRMAMIDGVLAEAERTFLHRLRDGLSMPPEIAAEIERSVAG